MEVESWFVILSPYVLWLYTVDPPASERGTAPPSDPPRMGPLIWEGDLVCPGEGGPPPSGL